MKVKILNQTHPEYDRERVAQIEALYRGGRAWRALINVWCPRHEVEEIPLWNDRKERATYTNHLGPILNRIAAQLFSAPPSLDEAPSEWWPGWWLSVDGKSTPAERWWRALFTESLKGRCAYVWVNMPASSADSPPANALEEQQRGMLDAFLVALTASQVLDWGEDEKGALSWILFHDVISVRGGPEQSRAPQYRWTYIGPEEITRWTWSPPAEKPEQVPKDSDEASESLTVQHGIGRIPVARLKLPHGLWAGEKAHDPALSYLRGRNDLAWALHKAAHATMVVKSKWSKDGIAHAPGNVLPLEQDDSVEYVEPSGRNFEILMTDCKGRREDLYRVVDQLAMAADGDADRSRMSGESKKADRHPMTVILSAYADLVRSAMRETVKIVAMARSENDDKITVSGLFEEEEGIRVFLENAAMATDARAMSPKFRVLVACREARRLLEDEVDEADLEEVIEEIKAAKLDAEVWSHPEDPNGKGDDTGDGDDEANGGAT